MKKSLIALLTILAIGVIAQVTVTVRQDLTVDQTEALKYLWRTTGAKSNGITLKDFSTNYTKIVLTDLPVVNRQWRISRIDTFLQSATDDQISAVETACGLQ